MDSKKNMGLFELTYKNYDAARAILICIRLLAQPKSMRSIIGATQQEQQHGSA